MSYKFYDICRLYAFFGKGLVLLRCQNTTVAIK